MFFCVFLETNAFLIDTLVLFHLDFEIEFLFMVCFSDQPQTQMEPTASQNTASSGFTFGKTCIFVCLQWVRFRYLKDICVLCIYA